MLNREYKNLDMNQWHCVFVRHSDQMSFTTEDYLKYGFFRNMEQSTEFFQLRNNCVALENSLYAMGDSRRGRVEPAESARVISDMMTWPGLTADTMGVLNSMLADLDQWARDSETNVVTEEPQKKSFFKRIFSK